MIRKATKTDAKAISPLLYNALHEIAEKITGGTTEMEVLAGLESWFSKKEIDLAMRTVSLKNKMEQQLESS